MVALWDSARGEQQATSGCLVAKLGAGGSWSEQRRGARQERGTDGGKEVVHGISNRKRRKAARMFDDFQYEWQRRDKEEA